MYTLESSNRICSYSKRDDAFAAVYEGLPMSNPKAWCSLTLAQGEIGDEVRRGEEPVIVQYSEKNDGVYWAADMERVKGYVGREVGGDAYDQLVQDKEDLLVELMTVRKAKTLVKIEPLAYKYIDLSG